jgi:uncharacterized membrane protein
MDFLALLGKTLVLRPYVFLFLTVAIVVSRSLMGGIRTFAFFIITWIVAFVSEFSSTRTGIPFGWYAYNGATQGQELYLSNIPFMDSLSFTFLLFASYCLSLVFASPSPRQGSVMYIPHTPRRRMAWPVVALSAFFFVLIDVIIDPVALRGDRWFLGKIYDYPHAGIHFGVPLTNYLGWAVVALIALSLFRLLDRRLRESSPGTNKAGPLLWGAALYYAVLTFNLAVTFWIEEPLLAWCGILIYLPVTGLLLIKLIRRDAVKV